MGRGGTRSYRFQEEDLATRRKQGPGEVRLASEPQARTTMSLPWIGQRRNMGRARVAPEPHGSLAVVTLTLG